MRPSAPLTVAFVIAMSLALPACGHRDAPVEDPIAAPAPAAKPPAATNGVLSAQVIGIERRSDHLSVRLRIDNLSDTAVEFRNLGDTLTGFRAQIEGRSYSAEARRRDGQPVAAASVGHLPGLTPVELDLRWELRPSPGIASYDSTIEIGNLFQADKKLPELSILIPGLDSRERRKPEKKPRADGDDKVSL